MISGASDEELDIAIARANVLLELQPKIDELKKENQELNQKYLNAVADYEQEKFNVEELKKQLEEKENIACNWKDSCLENAGKIEILENQQKEFIEYLEKNINHYKEIIKLDRENNTEQDCKRFEIRWTTYEEILSKYKEITGGKE